MRFQVIVLLFLCNVFEANSQSVFKVVESSRSFPGKGEVNKDVARKYFKIEALEGSTSIFYPISFPNGKFDTLQAIEQLLLLEGDERLCSLPIQSYNPLRSQIYLGACKDYSIQVEALFIINQLVLKKPFNYSSYPILVDKTSKEEASVGGSVVRKAFIAYKDWYYKIHKLGIGKIEENEIMPLDDSSIKWY
jgi:hypothetical protein